MERRFKALARERGAFIGVPIGVDPTPQGVEEFLDSCDAVHYEGPVGDVLARAYWEDGEEAGCISIPTDRITGLHWSPERLKKVRRRIEDRLRKDSGLVVEIARKLGVSTEI